MWYLFTAAPVKPLQWVLPGECRGVAEREREKRSLLNMAIQRRRLPQCKEFIALRRLLWDKRVPICNCGEVTLVTSTSLSQSKWDDADVFSLVGGRITFIIRQKIMWFLVVWARLLDKAIVFPVVMYGCESWTIKKAEHRRIDAFELWCWRRLLRLPWTARRSSQFNLKEISPEYSLKGLMLKLKPQYFRHLMWRTDSFEKTLMLGKIEGRRRRRQQRMRWLASPTQWTWVWVNSGSWWWTGRPCVLQSIGVTKSRTLLSNWAELSQTCLWVFRGLLWSRTLASGQTTGREQSPTH